MTRRGFLRAAGAGGAALWGSGFSRATAADAPAREGRFSMKLGLVTYLMGAEMTLDELITVCEKAGFDGVELRSTHKHGVEPSLSLEERVKVRERFAASTVKLACLGSACEYDSPDPAVVEKNVADTKAFVDLAADVGAQAVKVRPNNLHEDKGIAVGDTLRQIGETLKSCGDYAAGKGIELWLEMHGNGTSHAPHIRTIMDACNHPAVGLTWNCNGQDIVDGSVQGNYELVKAWIRCLHIHDLYETSYPYRELFALLAGDKWDGWANQEMDGSSDPQRVLCYYRALFDYMVDEAARNPAP